MRKRYLHAMFAQITLFIAIIILLLTLFLYFSFRNYSLELLNSSNEKLMNHVFEHAMQVNSYVDNYARFAFSDHDATRLMYETNVPMFDTLKSIRAVDETLSNIPFLISAYVYNGKEDTYYSIGPNPIIRHGQFYDHEITEWLSSDPSPTLVPIPRKMPHSEWDSSRLVNTYTYVLPQFMEMGSKVRNALILNIRADWLFNTLSSYRESDPLEHNNMMIIDPEGQVIGHADNKLFLENLSDESYVQKVLAANDASGYFMSNIDGVPSIVTYASYDLPQWKMINITPYSYVANTIHKVRTITLTIATSVLIVCLFAAFLLSKRLYNPIRTLRKQIGTITGRNSHVASESNELDFIAQTFVSTHHQMESLELFKKEHFSQLKQTFLKKWLLGETSTKDNLLEQLQTFNVNLHTSEPLVVILFKIDQYADFCSTYTEHDRSLLKYALMNITDEIMDPHFGSESVDMGGDHIAVIIHVSVDENTDQLSACIQEVHKKYKQYSQISVSATISVPTNSINKLASIYKDVLGTSYYRIVYGHGCILNQKEIEESEFDEFNMDYTLMNELLEELKAAKWIQLVQHFNSIMGDVHKLSYNNMMFYLSVLTSSIFQVLSSIEKNSAIQFSIDFVSFENKINSLETLEDIKTEYLALLKHAVDQMQQQKDEKTKLIVANVMKYVKLNYKDKNLSPQMVANYMNLTSAYTNKLFREETALSLADFITNTRLDEAKQLLVNSDYNIDEIIDAIGWENKKYFYTVFKRKNGVTPSEYRLHTKMKDLG